MGVRLLLSASESVRLVLLGPTVESSGLRVKDPFL